VQNNTQYTRCPQCKTAFKVNEKMLSMAHGKVRCGACLEVFQATDHILQPRAKAAFQTGATVSGERANDEAPAESEPSDQSNDLTAQADLSATAKSQTMPQDPVQSEFEMDTTDDKTDDKADEFTTPEDDDLGLTTTREDDLALDDMILSADSRATEAFKPELDSSALQGSSETDAGADADAEAIAELGESENESREDIQLAGQINDPEISFDYDDGIEESVDSAALSLDDDFVDAIEAESREALSPEAGLNQVTEERLAQDETVNDDLIQIETAQIEPVESESVESESVESESVESGTAESEQVEIARAETDLSLPDSSPAAVDEKAEPAFPEDFDDALDSDQLALADTQALEQLSDNLADQICDTDTEPDPLEEFEGRVEKKKTSLRTLVISATLVILLSWLSVNFWTERQTLAYDATWGGVTQGICSLLPCNIQPRRDVNQIRLRQRIVTPSEAADNQLDVKMLLVNEASFAQPYPQITIKFSNSLGEQVAIKHFSVADYFPEKQAQLMPAGTEIHITFATELPHPDALGFEFSFQ